MNDLTADEKLAIEKSAELWNIVVRLPIEHAEDQDEFRHMIHNLQDKILARPTRRKLKS